MQNEHDLYAQVGKQRLRPPTSFASRKYGKPLVNLITRMWQHSPSSRPSMTEVVADLEMIRQSALIQDDASKLQALQSALGATRLR